MTIAIKKNVACERHSGCRCNKIIPMESVKDNLIDKYIAFGEKKGEKRIRSGVD